MTDNAGSTESTARPSLREVVAKWLCENTANDDGYTDFLLNMMATDLLALLSQHGVVQVVRRGSPGINTAQVHSVRPLVEKK